MVSPLFVLIVLLAVAFLLPLLGEKAPRTSGLLFLISLAYAFCLVEYGLWQLISGGWSGPLEITTAGIEAPWAINLRFGWGEGIMLTAINGLSFLTAASFYRLWRQIGARAMSLFLLCVMGLNGLVMTRDLFNLFVFLEISSISLFGLIAMDLRFRSLTAAFKYMVAGGLASFFLLFGIIYLYTQGQTLNLDDLILLAQNHSAHPMVALGLFGVFMALIVEMKQWPANGWAMDVYHASQPGLAGFISAASAGALFFVVYKLLPLAPPHWLFLLSAIGLTTFVLSNLMGLVQENSNRLLGYSSIAQMGLLFFVITALPLWSGQPVATLFSQPTFFLILLGLFFNHFLAKAGLFWLSATLNKGLWRNWQLAGHGGRVLLFVMFILALAGLPPFPGFWAKWLLMMELGHFSAWWPLGLILLGSLFEVVYLFRWLGSALRRDFDPDLEQTTSPAHWLSLTLLGVLLCALGYGMSRYLGIDPRWYLGVVAAAGLFALGSLPELVKNALMLLLLSTYTLSLATSLSGMKLFFFLLFTAGPTLLLIASLARKEKDLTFAPLMLLLVPALGQLVLARDLLQFFFAWEWMTVASYFLVLKGKKAETGALTYIAFSVGGAFFLLAAVALGQAQVQSWGFDLMNGLSHHRSLFFALASVAFLVKMGAMGLHLWLPSSYTEAPDDVTPVLSAVLSKAGVMGLLILLLSFGAPVVYRINLATLLGWLGILTAFGATLVAIFQEDAKKLLAYSSMGQIGYIMVGFTTLSHLGWVSALYHTANHFLFKGLLFLAVAGVVYRVKTRNMYEMGGLIKRMPFSYFSVMIGIIAMSGVPPLTGFGSKWLLYEAMIERGWYLQTGIAFMSSTIAFLYLFRLVHSIFLGMPKEAHLEIKEAPLWFLIPQGLLILAIMVASMVPKWVIEPLSNWVHPILPATVRWEGHTLFSTLGYWNGSMMMVLVMSIFMGLLLWMWIARPKLQQVKPFNIGFAGEAPQRPEWTHYAYGFFEPYRRAFGPLLGPWVERSYASLYRFTQDCATLLRGIYTGNAQTYALFILITAVFTFFFTQGR